MSTTLLLLVPIGILGVAWAFCFVGCVFQTSGIPGPGYSGTITSDPNLVAYWPLGDLLVALNTQGATSGATDLSGHGHNGTYTIPPPYPAVPSSNVFPTPSLTRKTSIVPGDNGSTKNPLAASVDFEGGYVSIPWSPQSWPTLTDFTLEAWVQPSWTGMGNVWTVFGAFNTNNNAGFSLFVNGSNQWQINVGNGTAPVPNPATSAPADLTGITFVAVTFDSTTNMLSLWVNPGQDNDSNTPMATATQTFPNTTYVAVGSNAADTAVFFIGADDNFAPLRTPTSGTGAPLYSFQGQIQSVALYSSALSGPELATHFEVGSGGG